jgi:hypothetical protein
MCRDLQGDGGYRWESIACQKVSPLQFPKLSGAVLLEENEVDIASHGQRPERISRHEPNLAISMAQGPVEGKYALMRTSG